MRYRGLFLLFFASSIAGCSSEQTIVKSDPPTPATAALLEDCPAGSMISLEGTSCAPVGPTTSALPEGFTPAEDGWGFRAIVPSKRCEGATRTVIGKDACAPIDDCDAAFPPAGATVVGAGASLPEALANAKSGATLALDKGTYALGAQSIAIASDVKIVGRCARDVVVTANADTEAFAIARANVSIEGITIRGAKTGITVSSNANVRVAHALLEGLASGIRAYKGAIVTADGVVIDAAAFRSKDPVSGAVAQQNAKITFTNGDVRDTTEAFSAIDTGTTVTVSRTSAVSRVSSDAIYLMSMVGGALSIDESVIAVDRESMLVSGRSTQFSKTRDNATVKISKSELRNDTPFEGGLLAAMGGGKITLLESSLRHGAALALQSFETSSTIVLDHSVVTTVAKPGATAHGVNVIAGARAELIASAIVRARGVGVAVFDNGGQLTLDRSYVGATYAGGGSGDGLASFGVVVAKDCSGTLRDSVLWGNEQVALSVGYSSRIEADGLVIDGTKPSSDGSLGEGITATDDAKLFLHGSVVRRNAQLGLVVMRAAGRVSDSRFEKNAGAINVWESNFRKAPGAEEPGDRELLLDGNTFVETGRDVDNGEMKFTLPRDFGAL